VTWSDAVRPRDPALAARLLVGFTGTAAMAQLGYTLVTPVVGGWVGALLSYGIPVALLLAASAIWAYPQRVPTLAWVGVPLLGLMAITVLDVTSGDTTVEGQVFLFFPVLFAASQLRRVAAGALTALALAAEQLITFCSEPVKAAALDSGYICAGLAATSWLLQHSAAVQDRLMGRMARLAMIDPLTGLATRRTLDDVAQAALAGDAERRRPTGDAGTCLLVLDLDLFKSVNDTHGHPVGDDFLVHVGRFLQDRCRPSDVVCRLGGDEFAVLLTDCPYEAAMQRGRQLVEQAATAPFRTADGVVIPLRFSVGVGHVPAGGTAGIRELYTRADAALYGVKALGRGRAG
jgi:diguanylate cyclase (GGDEF)-like protein